MPGKPRPAARTGVEADLDARIRAFAGDERRAEVLRRARRFKSSWVELGEALTEVLQKERFRAWGFGSFEDYCKRELHLRAETALKLTGSYGFLRKRAPEVLDRDGTGTPIPDWKAVDFWQRAEQVEELPEGTLDDVRRAVLDDVAGAGVLARRFGQVIFPRPADEEARRTVAELRRVARRLADLIADAGEAVPRPLAEALEEHLDRLMGALPAAPPDGPRLPEEQEPRPSARPARARAR